MVVFSPSNLSTHVQCPRKFWGQSIAKTLKWKASQQKSRGTLVHSALEKAVKEGWDAVKSWPDGMDMDFARQQVALARNLVAAGMTCYIEHEMCVEEVKASMESIMSAVPPWLEGFPVACEGEIGDSYEIA